MDVSRVAVFLLASLPLAVSAQSTSRSVGLVNAGRLIDAAELESSDTVRLTHEPARYGTQELVGLIQASADAVRRARSTTPPLVVGDLSRRRGGAFPPHLSHRAGRDADVGFYYVDREGRPYPAQEFITVRGGGACALDDSPCRLDVARTWSLMAAMLTDEAQVQYMVMAQHLRDLLLDEAERQAAPSDLITRFRLVTAPMAQSNEHRNHFHLRVYCAPDDRPRCRDEGAMHPWYRFSEGADPAFVARHRERGRARYAAEVAAEPRARRRRQVARERRAAAARAAVAEAERLRAHRERIRARRRAALETLESERQRQRDARAARLARARAAQEAARREREAFRAMTPEARRAEVRRRRAVAEAAEATRRAEVRRVMAERAEARRREAAERRAEMRERHRSSERQREERARARREAYVAHLAARRGGRGQGSAAAP